MKAKAEILSTTITSDVIYKYAKIFIRKFSEQCPKVKQRFALKSAFWEGDSYSPSVQEVRDKEHWAQHELGTRHKEV